MWVKLPSAFGVMRFRTADKLVFFWCVAEYLDGLKTKAEIYNQVYEDIQNNLLNRL